MAFGNNKIIGLGAKRNFSDVQNATNALNALNLPPNDLDIIRGSANAGVTNGDWISLSRLSLPIYKTLDRYSRESSVYSPIILSKAGTDAPLFGNLTVNGNISGQSIRYRYIVGVGTTASIKFADVSSSRVSAWNPSVIPSNNNTPISYGARVGILTGGELRFGTPTTSGQIRLQTTLQPELKEFATEVPTHKIKCFIGGKEVYLYAMKGIPLVFRGAFRNVDASITVNPTTPRPNWKVQDVNNLNLFSNFTNTATINYRSVSFRERFIKFYYNPDNIRTITINSANLTSFTEVGLSNATSFNLFNNQFKNFPNFATFTPSLISLNLRRNPLYLSDTLEERRFNTILSKLPTTLEQLYLGETFFGSLGADGTVGINSIAQRLPNLKILDLSRDVNVSRVFFSKDSFDTNGYIPNVPNTCETYNISGNDFLSIAPSSGISTNVKDLTNLKNLNLLRNVSLADATFSIASNKIESVNISNTLLPCPDLNNKPELLSFDASADPNVGFLTTSSNLYKFDNCTKLQSLNFEGSGLSGRFPQFTNENLLSLNLSNTRIIGGRSSDGNQSFVIHNTTLQSCPKLQRFDFYIQSGVNLITAPIESNAFVNNINLVYLRYNSSGITTGNIPNLSSCSKLTELYLNNNNFTGNIPPLATNPSISRAYLNNNSLSGSIPSYSNLNNLSYLILNNNQFTSLSQFGSLPRLEYLYVHNNKISGNIPSFANCPRLAFINLSSNLFNGYISGSFSTLYSLKTLDVSSNQLQQTSINAIVDDLFINYNAAKRSRVIINLRSNLSVPSSDRIEKINILISKGWSISYG